MLRAEKIDWDKGSFRDPAGVVFFYEGKVFRTLSDNYFEKIKNLLAQDFLQDYVRKGKIITTNIIKNPIPELKSQYLLEHEKIPFVIYPHEWSFNMLKDAAVLTLEFLKLCLQNGYILKDGTAWNLTYNKGKMVFFDILSIDEYKDGQTWDGYGQFCQEFLYPLMIYSYKRIPHHIFFKGGLKGVDSFTANEFFRKIDLFKPGVLKHLYLNKVFSNDKKISENKVKGITRLPKISLINIIENLLSIINRLEVRSDKSIWNNYVNDNTYTTQDNEVKERVILNFFRNSSELKSVLDIGCNTGKYSQIAAKYVKTFSCDIDPICVDQIYLDQKKHFKNIHPFTLDLMNPSSNCGWDLNERKSIFERLRTDSFLALALVHHICISGNVPLELFVRLLTRFGNKGVVEWIDKSDPMVQFLLRNREDVFENYTWEKFENIVGQYFHIEATIPINNGTRKLCELRKL